MKVLEDNVERSLLRDEHKLDEDASSNNVDVVSLQKALRELKLRFEVWYLSRPGSSMINLFLQSDGHGTSKEKTSRRRDEEREDNP